jgi:hypothetical protein
VGACCHVLKWQALNVVASQGAGSIGDYPILKAPRCGSWEPGYILNQGDEAGWADRW